MIRFILSCLVAVALIGGAPAVAAMQASPAQQSECAMPDRSDSRSADSDKMPCCTSDCTMTGTASLSHPGPVDPSVPNSRKAPLFLALIKELHSLNLAAADPPPRLPA